MKYHPNKFLNVTSSDIVWVCIWPMSDLYTKFTSLDVVCVGIVQLEKLLAEESSDCA